MFFWEIIADFIILIDENAFFHKKEKRKNLILDYTIRKFKGIFEILEDAGEERREGKEILCHMIFW